MYLADPRLNLSQESALSVLLSNKVAGVSAREQDEENTAQCARSREVIVCLLRRRTRHFHATLNRGVFHLAPITAPYQAHIGHCTIHNDQLLVTVTTQYVMTPHVVPKYVNILPRSQCESSFYCILDACAPIMTTFLLDVVADDQLGRSQ